MRWWTLLDGISEKHM